MGYLHIVLAVALALVLALSALSGWLAPSVPYKSDIVNEAGKTIGALLVVALIFERSLAVFNSLIFGDELSRARTDLIIKGATAGLQTEWDRYQRVLEKHEKVRLSLALALGTLVSAAGIRTLAGILEVDACSAVGNHSSLQFFFLTDILLTASLLAGGSNALAKLVEAIRNRVELMRLQSIRASGDARLDPP